VARTRLSALRSDAPQVGALTAGKLVITPAVAAAAAFVLSGGMRCTTTLAFIYGTPQRLIPATSSTAMHNARHAIPHIASCPPRRPPLSALCLPRHPPHAPTLIS